MMDDGPQSYDPFNDYACFEYKYSLKPRRCYNTGQQVWGLAVRGRRSYRYADNNFAHEDRWYHRNEAIIMMLKGK